jgi:hypothetical protein
MWGSEAMYDNRSLEYAACIKFFVEYKLTWRPCEHFNLALSLTVIINEYRR